MGLAVKIVEAIRSERSSQSIYQLVSSRESKTFYAVSGNMLSGEAEMNFAPQIYRGGGFVMPENRSMQISYTDATKIFNSEIPKLENMGFVWHQ